MLFKTSAIKEDEKKKIRSGHGKYLPMKEKRSRIVGKSYVRGSR